MTCGGNNCACLGVNKFFDVKRARKEYKRYLRRGPPKMTRRLIAALKKEELEGKSVLDIGGGLGAIHHELLSAGAERATDVDGSEAYIEKSKEEGKRLGHEHKVVHHFGDYIDHAESIGEADIVTLDKVICCYKDMRELVTRSSANARHYYGIIYPLDRWRIKWFAKVANVIVKFKSVEFQSYIHDEEEIEGIILSNGFKRQYYYKNLIWQTILYVK